MAIGIPFNTGYLYAFVHASSLIYFTSSYGESQSQIVRLGTSGGRLAILMLLVSMTASSI